MKKKEGNGKDCNKSNKKGQSPIDEGVIFSDGFNCFIDSFEERV